MRFFTPELFVRFNSPDDEEADRADAEWESAVTAYRAHLDGIRDRLPAQGRKLADLCLHDAELPACDQAVGFHYAVDPGSTAASVPNESAIAVVAVKHGDALANLIYSLEGGIREHPAPDDWPFSKARTHWLYDEIDLGSTPPGTFVHRVLLSDGRVLEIPFLSVFVQTPPPSAPAEAVIVRRSA